MTKTEQEKIIKSLANIHFKEAEEKALNGQVLIVLDAKTKTYKFIDIERLDFKSDTANKVNAKDLFNYMVKTNEELTQIKQAYNKLVKIVNSNQEANSAAINDLREDMEKGKIF